ncbi:MAG: hypothetical protein SOY89_07210, partial [Dysosmobacter sp.]|nr:hypothetical protein [Dysosmobacter sp.]
MTKGYRHLLIRSVRRQHIAQVQGLAVVPQALPHKISDFAGTPVIALKWAGKARPFQDFRCAKMLVRATWRETTLFSPPSAHRSGPGACRR